MKYNPEVISMINNKAMAELEVQCRNYFTGQAKKIVFGEGNIKADIMLIGEAPGRQEIEQGRPFVGQAGKNLNEFLQLLNITRDDIYITNAVKFRPTKISPKTNRVVNRPPVKSEIKDSKDFLIGQIKIIVPQIIVTLGNVPMRVILNNEKVNIGDVHGTAQSIYIDNVSYSVFPLYHPASIIYKRDLKAVYEQDLLKLKNIIS